MVHWLIINNHWSMSFIIHDKNHEFEMIYFSLIQFINIGKTRICWIGKPCGFFRIVRLPKTCDVAWTLFNSFFSQKEQKFWRLWLSKHDGQMTLWITLTDLTDIFFFLIFITVFRYFLSQVTQKDLRISSVQNYLSSGE